MTEKRRFTDHLRRWPLWVLALYAASAAASAYGIKLAVPVLARWVRGMIL